MDQAPDESAAPFLTPRRVLVGLDVAMAIAAAAAIAALALEYGFYELPGGVTLGALHVVEGSVLAIFVLNRFAHLTLSSRRRRFLRENWIDFALMLVAAALAGLALAGKLRFKILPAATTYVIITQIYIMAVVVVRTVSFHLKVAESGIHPIWTVIGSFAVVILFGAGLLMLPKAAPVAQPLSVTDAVFSATSATCVTGLIVRDTGADFTRFGQVVILSLIQLGALGIMIFGTLFALLAGRGLSVRESLLAGQVLSDETIGRAARMVKFVVLAAFGLEAIGAVAMYRMWHDYAAPGQPAEAAFTSVFHAISAFCNAGFSLESASLRPLRDSWQVMGVMAPLIFLGGLGFPVLYSLVGTCWRQLRRALGRGGAGPPAMTLHAKLVLTTSVVLLVVGAAGLVVIEKLADPMRPVAVSYVNDDNPVAHAQGSPISRMPLGQAARQAVFQSVTARTAGFNTVQMDRLTPGGKLWMCLLMIVGGSPASTAGGMKTVTLAVLVLGVWGMLRRREQIEGFRRSIAEGFLRKALVLAGLYLMLVLTTTLLLCVDMTGRRLATTGEVVNFMQIFFEACSACGTVGLTCGVTTSLTAFGKYVIIFAMFIGRLGPLTLLLALTIRLKPARYAYPSEEVILA